MSVILPTKIMLEIIPHYIEILIEETGILTVKEYDSIKQGVFAWPEIRDRALSVQAAVRNLKLVLPAYHEIIQDVMLNAYRVPSTEYYDFLKKYTKRHSCYVDRGNTAFLVEWRRPGTNEDTTGLLTQELKFRLIQHMYTGIMFRDKAERIVAEKLHEIRCCCASWWSSPYGLYPEPRNEEKGCRACRTF